MVKKARFDPSNDTTTIKNMKFMKQIILSLIVLLGASLNACMAKDNQTSETRDISGYTAIHIDGVATVRFTQGDTWACRVEGEAKEVGRLTTTVKNGTLTIDQRKEGKGEQDIHGVTLYLTAPTLDEVEIDGVGTFGCETPLKTEDIHCEINGVGTIEIEDLHCCLLNLNIDGVGKGDIRVYCDQLKARADGVSSLKLSGKARKANIKDSFLGRINSRRLKIGE